MPALIKTARTFSNDVLQNYRQQGDGPADAVIAAVTEAGGPQALSMFMRWLADTSSVDLGQQPAVVQAFFNEYSQLPPWADQDLMARGMAFFQKHAGLIGLVLGTFSLPYCYLGAHGAQVLWMTERIKSDTTRRLQETGEWVFAVNNPKEWALTSPPAPLLGGEGGKIREHLLPSPPRRGAGGEVNAINRTLKIRLIHAAVRWFSLHSGRWNMEWGYPVNQEDMAGTSGAFSYIVIRGLRKAGVKASEADEEAYLHHINVVGYLNGVTEELLPQNLREAFLLDRMIAKRQFAPSEAGIGLTKSLLNSIGEQLGSDTFRNLAAAQMRFFLGDRYADLLNIPSVSLEKQLVGAVNKLPIFSKLIPARLTPSAA
ncbi:oxygenase MpaB family protein [Spirosoma knui]